MPLLNYTTKVPVNRTIVEIRQALVKAGARSITDDYDPDGTPSAVTFTVPTAYGLRTFKLPVDTESTLAVMQRQKIGSATHAQARRVAWRILKDWVEAQLAIIETEMATLDQVMLPYMQIDDGRTVYEEYVDQQRPALPGS